MRRCVLTSRFPVFLLAAAAALPACNAIFGIEPGTRAAAGSGGSTSEAGASGTTSGGGGAPASSTGGGGDAGAGAGDSFTYPGEVRWAFTPESAGGVAYGVAYGADGDKVFVGGFDGYGDGGDFGDGPIPTGGGHDAFVVKYGPQGEIRWARALSGPGDQRAHGVAVDATGHVLVTGHLAGSASFPGGPELTATEGSGDPAAMNDIFVAKLTPDGEHAWSLRLGDGESQWGVRVAADSEGNVIVAGAGSGEAPLDGTFKGYTDADGKGIFVAKLTPDGAPLWSWKFPVDFSCQPPWSMFPGTLQCSAVGLAVDASDNIILAANTMSDPGIGKNGGTLYEESLGGIDVVVWKLDAAGAPLWGRILGGDDEAQNGDQWASAVAVNPAGEILLAGGFTTSVRFGDGSGDHVVTGHEDADIFVAKLSPGGEALWERAFGDLGGEEAMGIAVDDLSNIGVIGAITSAPGAEGVDFGDGERLAPAVPDASTNSDLFVAKLDDRGGLRWAHRLGDEREQMGVSIALDRSAPGQPGNAAVCGWYFTSLKFGAGPQDLFNPGYGPFMAEYGP
ncbi:hypothetical protein AB3662_00720 [Sorangium cellulosum]|uniref:hypothetical protein n=1 Tax=Sorangium cellulosum TaxID=56 RepID=UPI003D9A405D